MKGKIGGIILYCVGNVLICYFFHLFPVWLFMTVCIGALALPIFFRLFARATRYETEFYEMTTYMDQLICSYKRTGHIHLALHDCCAIFDKETKIYHALQKALCILETGEGVTSGTVMASALREISKLYNSRRIKLLHRFLCQIEKMGGEIAEALDILMTDLQMWKRRTILYKERKKVVYKEYVVSVVLAVLLCLFSHVLMPSDILAKVEKMTIYQLSTSVVIEVFVGLSLLLLFLMATSWLDFRWSEDKAIEIEFSYWILAVTVYLQSNRVYCALSQSLEEVSGQFRARVEKLLEDIYEKPNSLKPYLQFYGEKNLPEIHTGMKLLYSVNQNGYQDTKKQVKLLVEQNQLLMEQCEKTMFENRVALFCLFKQMPMVIAGAKIVVDVISFLYVMARQVSLLTPMN